ncbi:MAG: ATP-binding protein [Verrucomicrobia bacterium]|nr:ATP-binding protein [Verrucomicrobiota bacterium]
MNEKTTSPAMNQLELESTGTFKPRPVSPDALQGIEDVGEEVGGPYTPQPETEGAVAFTHFDTPSSEDNSVTILLTKENMDKLPSQALVRIKSLKDDGSVDRCYLAVVVAGPFAEPDGLRADSPIVVTTTVQGKIFLPRYHGRASVQILGEEIEVQVPGEELDKQLIPPRYRPRPNSPVFTLDAKETAKVLRVGGAARLGLVVGQEEIVVAIPDTKSVLPRHLGILGTTGGGKSTTVSGAVYQLQKVGYATILIDVEGEYTEIDQPTEDRQMRTALDKRGLKPDGTKNLHIFHLVGRETGREADGGSVCAFCLHFSDLSPYAVKEILELPDAQEERFWKAYDTLKLVLKDLDIFPKKGEERMALEIDEMETGCPRMTLLQLIDVVGVFTDLASQSKEDKSKGKAPEESDELFKTFGTFSPEFRGREDTLKRRAAAARAPGNLPSWKGLLGKLWRVQRLRIFDNLDARGLDFAGMLQPGRVSVIDLSDTDSPQVNNLVIASILRGVQKQQEENFLAAQSCKERPTPVVIFIEEAHEFLSQQRIKQMPVLFQQVARIAKRGRKRWLGLAFVTQLPQHLPDEVLGLINNFVLHKISDGGVVDRLRKSISGIDKSQWNMLPGLAPGQALVSLTSMARPLLVSIDPTPCKLRYVE